MKEVEITCVCPNIRLVDLGLSLTKGEIAHVSVARAQKSQDLTLARRAQGVRVREIERARVVKPRAGNRPVRRKNTTKNATGREDPHRAVATPPQRNTTPLTVSPPTQAINTSALVRDISRNVIAALRPELRQAVAAPTPSGHTAPSIAQPDDDTPRFIPSGIVGNAQGEVSVESQESTSDALDKASAALKARKKPRKRTRKKKKTEE